MRKRSAEKRKAAAKAAEERGKRNRIHTASENRPQRTHDDLMKIWKDEKCSWYRFKHYRTTVLQ
jgi:hypothetical protein